MGRWGGERGMESPAGSDEEGDGQEGKGEERWQGVGGEDDSSGTDDHEEGAGDEGKLPIPPPPGYPADSKLCPLLVAVFEQHNQYTYIT